MKGKILGNRYELLEKIGEGGMANVYTAKCHILNRIVAVKILKEEFTSDEEFAVKFRNEALAAASLNQENIINVYDVGQEGDIAYIVMEYVEGIDVKEYIRRNGKQEEQKAFFIVRQIACALAEAHRKKIIHRDIKPHNIMITKENRVKVGDFGIAKAVTESTITATHGSVLGSVHYFSPEQARGGYMDERSDIYSLGIVLYELLTGTVPFSGETPVNVALKHIHDKVELPKDLVVSENTRSILRKMTDKNVDKRYVSVDELIRDIDGMRRGKDIYSTGSYSDGFETKKIVFNKEEIQKINKATREEEREKGGEVSTVSGENRKSSRKITAIAVITAFLAAGAFLITVLMVMGPEFFSFSFLGEEKIVVPSFQGKTLEEAQSEGQSLGLAIEKGSEIVNSKFEPGKITDQTPQEGMKVEKGQIVRVTISKGDGEEAIELKDVKVPDVTSIKIDEAESRLDALGLYTITNFEYSTSVASDIVISQEPAVGTMVKERSEVILKVSRGREQVLETVPSFEGKSLAQAEAIKGNFKLEILTKEDKAKEDGVILSQNPKAGTDVKQGAIITIVLNKIEQPVVVEPPKPQIVKKNITLLLPEKEQVNILIKDIATGATVYNQAVVPENSGGILSLDIDGEAGTTKQFEIYFDDEHIRTESLTFE